MADSGKKTCFVIAPIGEPESEVRKRSDQVLRHVIQPAAGPLGYEITRADALDQPGNITSQVIEHILDDELVVADLTERNPNVFYELGIRHTIARPFIQLMKTGDALPFDIVTMRTIFVNLQDPDSVSSAKTELSNQIRNLESNPSDLGTPVTASVNLKYLHESERPNEQLLAEFLAVAGDIRAGQSQSQDAVLTKLSQIEETLQVPRQLYRPPLRRFIRMLGGRAVGAYDFVVVTAGFRESAPWLYEIGMEVFRQAVNGNIEKAKSIYGELERLAVFTDHYSPESFEELIPILSSAFERLIHSTSEPSMADDLPF